MKRLSFIFLLLVGSQLRFGLVWAGGIGFGMTGAVHSKINELDEKVRSPKETTTTARSLLLGKYEPADGKILLIIGQDEAAHDQYITDIGAPGGLMFYTSVQRMELIKIPGDNQGGTFDFPLSFADYPDLAIQIGLYMKNALDGVVVGTYNSNIDKLGDWIKASQRPVFLRIGYEFDYPDNDYDPVKYITAFRFIVDRLRAQGVTNAAYVWHSYASDNSTAASAWYPGDSYVDWIGISFFATANSERMNDIAAIAAQHNKPLMIAEAAPYGIGTLSGQSSWDNWFKPFFDFVSAKKVKAISYINWDWETIPMFRGGGWGNCRIQDNAVVKAHWISETSQGKYLQSSTTLYSDLGY